jgi:hypothetical protein
MWEESPCKECGCPRNHGWHEGLGLFGHQYEPSVPIGVWNPEVLKQ